MADTAGSFFTTHILHLVHTE